MTELQKPVYNSITMGKYKVAYSVDPLEIEVDDIYMDHIWLSIGFSFRISCNYPEANMTAPIRMSNVLSEYSQSYDNPLSPGTVIYTGPGNQTFTNINMTNLYVYFTAGKPPLTSAHEVAWVPDDGLTQTIDTRNIHMSLKDNKDLLKYNAAIFTYPFPMSRFMNITLIGKFSLSFPKPKIIKNNIVAIFEYFDENFKVFTLLWFYSNNLS